MYHYFVHAICVDGAYGGAINAINSRPWVLIGKFFLIPAQKLPFMHAATIVFLLAAGFVGALVLAMVVMLFFFN